jgi:hypothetical protein
MKRTITTLALAAPLATAALSLGVAPAMAEPAGPAIDQLTQVAPGPINPHLPHGPGDTTAPVDDPDPEPEPDPEPGPGDGPDDKVSIPQPCPIHGDCTKDPGDDDGNDPGDKVGIPVPKRIDAGTASSEGDLELGWLIAGLGTVTASGAAYAVRRRTRTLA